MAIMKPYIDEENWSLSIQKNNKVKIASSDHTLKHKQKTRKNIL